jgi:hypothetical protein
VVSDNVHNLTPFWLAPNGNCDTTLETGDVIEGLPRFSPSMLDARSLPRLALSGQPARAIGVDTPLTMTGVTRSSGDFDPNNLANNYIADAGISPVIGGRLIYSFTVPGGSQFVVVVNEVNQNGGIGQNYNLERLGRLLRVW